MWKKGWTSWNTPFSIWKYNFLFYVFRIRQELQRQRSCQPLQRIYHILVNTLWFFPRDPVVHRGIIVVAVSYTHLDVYKRQVGVLFISSYQLNASSSAQLRLPNETISCALTICIKTTSSDYISRKCCCSCSLLIINKVLVNSTALGYSYITFAAIQFVLLRSGFLDLTSLVNYIQEIVVFVYSVVCLLYTSRCV